MTAGCCLLLLASHRRSMGGSHHQTTQLCTTEKPAAIHHKNLQCGRQANKARSGGWNLSASPPSSQLGEGQLVKESDPTTAGMGNAGKAMTHSCSLSANPITSKGWKHLFSIKKGCLANPDWRQPYVERGGGGVVCCLSALTQIPRIY